MPDYKTSTTNTNNNPKDNLMAQTPWPSRPIPEDTAASGPDVARFGVGDEPWGANDYGFGIDTPLVPLVPLGSPIADEGAR
jgi:hypothetical protein